MDKIPAISTIDFGFLKSLSPTVCFASQTRVELKVLIGSEHLQPFRLTHGGLNCSLIELVGLIGCSQGVDPSLILPFTVHCQHVNSSTSGDQIKAVGRAVKQGNRLQTWEVELMLDRSDDSSCTDNRLILAQGMFTASVSSPTPALNQLYSVVQSTPFAVHSLSVHKGPDEPPKLHVSALSKLAGLKELSLAGNQLFADIALDPSHFLQISSTPEIAGSSKGEYFILAGIVGEELGSVLSELIISQANLSAEKSVSNSTIRSVGTSVSIQYMTPIRPTAGILRMIARCRGSGPTVHLYDFDLCLVQKDYDEEKQLLVATGSLSVFVFESVQASQRFKARSTGLALSEVSTSTDSTE